jgi:hypothetical protein
MSDVGREIVLAARVLPQSNRIGSRHMEDMLTTIFTARSRSSSVNFMRRHAIETRNARNEAKEQF